MNRNSFQLLYMILKRIKEETQDKHTSLENSALLRPISQKSLKFDEYIRILQKFYGFFYPLELQIARFPVAAYLPDFIQRRKAGLLLHDLQQLQPLPPDAVPLCQDLPVVDNLAHAFGCLYVMEGSTLGGKMIYKTVKETLGIDEDTGVSFFYGYGPNTGQKWKDFQQTLQTVSSSHTTTDSQMIAAANSTFDKLKRWFEKE